MDDNGKAHPVKMIVYVPKTCDFNAERDLPVRRNDKNPDANEGLWEDMVRVKSKTEKDSS